MRYLWGLEPVCTVVEEGFYEGSGSVRLILLMIGV